MGKYKHLFFDLDHTLWDFDANSQKTLEYLYQVYHLQERGVKDFVVFKEHYEYYNEMLWSKLRNGNISREELRWRRMQLVLAEFGIDDLSLAYELSSVYLDMLPDQGQLLEGALEILNYCLGKEYHMHIITNGFETTQYRKLDTSNLRSYFNHIFTSECVNSMKPHKPIFEFALQTTGAGLEDSLMIGDSLEADIIGAKSVGMDQVYYNPYAIRHKEVVTYEIAHLKELMEII